MARAQPGGEDSRFVANAPSYSIADFSAASLIHSHHRAPLQYVTSAAGAATHRGSTPDFASRGGTDDGLPGMLTDSDLPPAVESKLRLCEENVSLRQELASLTAKLAQLQKFERDLDSIREQHDILQQSTDKQERLEQAFRTRLEDRCRRLEQVNKQLKAKLEDERRQTDSVVLHARDEMMEELMRRDRIIHTLTAQCTTGQEECDRLRHEIVDLGEKGQVIPQLETRVSESDARLKRVNEEFTRQVSQAIPIREFEAALRELREVSTRQDALDIQQRERLESDVNLLRLQLERCKQPYSPDGMPSEPPGNVTPQQICDFEALLCRRESHIQQLQEDVVKWRQLYSDELNLVASTDTNGLRSYPTRSQSLADVTSDERNSSDQHRQQQQQQQQEQQRRRVEIVSADLFSANRRVVELETVVKQLRFLMTDLSKELTNVRRLRDEDERQVGRDIATAATTAAGDRENRNGGHDGGGDDERAASPDSSSSFPLSPISKNGTSFGSVEHL